MDFALRLLSQGDRWLVLCRGFHEHVPKLRDEDLREIADVPSTWNEVIARLAPRADWRLDERAMRAIGALLHRRLITGRIAEVLQQDEADARSAKMPLRLVVHVFEDEQDPLLRRLPIELLFQQLFWFRRSDLIGARLPDEPDEGEVRFSEAPRAVIAWAGVANRAPSDEQLRAHGTVMAAALQRAGFAVELLERCTAAALQRATERGCELLHLACHGEENLDSKGQLLLDRTLTGTELGEWLYTAGQSGRRVQVVLLCACSSAALHSTWASGMAQHLAGGKLAMAAVGFRAPVGVAEALPFMEAIAEHLASKVPFEEAFCRARRAMRADTPDWTLPILFARERRPTPVSKSIAMPRFGVDSLLPTPDGRAHV
jgi:GNAT superfamily N-acetyltransferase